jgi:formylglycine-generating enzyme required for sulfatase activity
MKSPSSSSRLAHLSIQLAWAALVLLSQSGCDRNTSSPTTKTEIKLTPTTNMVPIKAGTFTRLKFPVTITHDFWMAKYEVTQWEFASVLTNNPSHFTGDSNRPVEKVTLLAANSYCSAITQRERAAGRLPANYEYRLPTEAEWEYACLAGSTNRFSFSEEPGVAEKYAWTAENSDAITHPVGLKLPNAWGLHDMHGNVWEWCSDWFEPYPPAPLTDPVGPASGKYKVFKGGGWNQDLEFARSANRFMMSPSNGIHFVGFRVALSPIKPPPTRPNPLLP